MSISRKSLLSKKVFEGVALNQKFSKIKPRLTLIKKEGFKRLTNTKVSLLSRLTIIFLIILFLLGYHPALIFPPVQKSVAFAIDEQTQDIESDLLPKISLPHPAYLSTRFSPYHKGVDLATGLGMPIHPITEGVVEEVNFGIFGYGNHVIIAHAKGLKSLYGHMDKIFVKVGQIVKDSDLLGTVGMTGNTSGPHTHLEITRNGDYIDPVTILPPLQDYPSEEYLKPYTGDMSSYQKSKS